MTSCRQPLAVQKASSNSDWRMRSRLLIVAGHAGIADRRHVFVAEAEDFAHVVITDAALAAPIKDQLVGEAASLAGHPAQAVAPPFPAALSCPCVQDRSGICE